MPGEFELIERYFRSAASGSAHAEALVLGLGDDCALVRPPAHEELIAHSTDTLVEGVHFLADICGEDLAWRLVSASVSDLAAMGAKPLWLSLAVTLPDSDEAWLASFSRGLQQALKRYSIRLIGGDTTSGAVRVVTAHVQGSVKADRALLRSGAQPGDLIYVSGTLGDSRAGLEQLGAAKASSTQDRFLQQRFLRPTARTELGMRLTGIASAAVDISDGLLADLGHLLRASSVGAQLAIERLPLSEQLVSFVGESQAREWAATGGEDFELCFTIPATSASRVAALSVELGLSLRAIGEIVAGSELDLVLDGTPWELRTAPGFDHFGGSK